MGSERSAAALARDHDRRLPPPRIFLAPTLSAPWIASNNRVDALLQEQHRGECRLCLILREAVALKRGQNANRVWCWDYDAGPPAITCLAETWIQTVVAIGLCLTLRAIRMKPDLRLSQAGEGLDSAKG